MKLLIALLLCVSSGAPAWSGTLSDQDAAKLKSDVVAIYQAVEKGDSALLIDNTHESIYALFGGKEKFEKITREAVKQLLQLDIKFLSSEVGVPTQTYSAGDEEICFVPRVSVMELQGKRAKSATFMIAIRRVGSKTWKYLDGTGLRKNPEVLAVLLPKLAKDVKLPPNTVELL